MGILGEATGDTEPHHVDGLPTAELIDDGDLLADSVTAEVHDDVKPLRRRDFCGVVRERPRQQPAVRADLQPKYPRCATGCEYSTHRTRAATGSRCPRHLVAAESGRCRVSPQKPHN
jgi:hypothetical protein